jgi:RNA-binding protein 39
MSPFFIIFEKSLACALWQVHDVRLILDNKSHRSKGIAYVEFREVESVPLALALSGQRLLGVPIIVQPSHAERNRIASAAAAAMKSNTTGPMRLYVGSLHYNITEDMIRGIFEPFGKVCILLDLHRFEVTLVCAVYASVVVLYR